MMDLAVAKDMINELEESGHTVSQHTVEHLRDLLNDQSVNMHSVLSRTLNRGAGDSDWTCVCKVRRSWQTGAQETLTDHEFSHLQGQRDFLFHATVIQVLADDWEPLVAVWKRFMRRVVYQPGGKPVLQLLALEYTHTHAR